MNEGVGEKTRGPKIRKHPKPELAKPSRDDAKNRAVATHTQICEEVPEHVTDIRRRGPHSDAANAFRSSSGKSMEARKRCVDALKQSYANPHRRLDEIAAENPHVYVDRDYHGYDGFVFLRAVQRFAKAARQGTVFVFGCTCGDEACHRVCFAEFVNDLAEYGLWARQQHPFPDPEIKMRSWEPYRSLAYLNYIAWIDKTYVNSVTDDVAWMFYQLWLHASERHLCQCTQVLPRKRADGSTRLTYCILVWYVLNMGGRPNSKIAC